MASAPDDRDWLRSTHHTASRDFDKAIMVLAGGALGLSITFVHDIAPHPDHRWTLGVAWVGFTASLVLILVSHLASQAACLALIGDIDAERSPGDRFDMPGWLTTALNIGAATTLVGGVAFLVLFALYNL